MIFNQLVNFKLKYFQFDVKMYSHAFYIKRKFRSENVNFKKAAKPILFIYIIQGNNNYDKSKKY